MNLQGASGALPLCRHTHRTQNNEDVCDVGNEDGGKYAQIISAKTKKKYGYVFLFLK